MNAPPPSGYERDTRARLDTHIETVNLHLETLGNKIDDQKKTMQWAAGLVVSIMLSVMAWALIQQYNANESQKADLKQQITLLQQQEAARNQTRTEILERLPPPQGEAAQAPSASDTRRP